MLAFMRKHQKYFFVVITIVIVISFSFFGTYSTLAGNSIHEQTAFTSVDGQPVSRAQLEEMALFIGTDADDKKLFGGIWGPNFLNDGVIRKDFLETGLANILMSAYADDLQVDLKNRFTKEARYRPYTHPQAKFLSSMNVWNYFAPQIPSSLQTLQKSQDALSPDALDARVQLFLAERRFPAPYLKQILNYQENQNKGIEKDPQLLYQDLSLFGYHTVDDWFGAKFIRLISEFIYNSAAIAEERGYKVSKEETLADLMRNAEISFNENKSSPQLGVATSAEYLDQQLARMRLDKSKAVKIWEKVLLFRRLFQDEMNAVFVDPNSYESFNAYAHKGVAGDLYQLPELLRFSDFKTFQQFEVYLDKVAKRMKDDKNILLLPKEFLSAAEVAKKTPELVQKRYTLEIASADKKQLEAQVTVKQTLAWEVDAKNWAILKKEFPELGLKKSETNQDRLSSLESLDAMTRNRLDQFARKQMVLAHPEWMEAALNNAQGRSQVVSIALKGKNLTFEGLLNGEELIKFLDKAPLNQEDPSLNKISFNQDRYYRIKVLERSPDFEILTFDAAKKNGILDSLTDQVLEVAYVQMRSQDPADYQNADKSWKPLEEVRDKVAEKHFAKVLDGVKAKLAKREDAAKYQHLEQSRLVPYRFIADAENLLNKLKSSPSEGDSLTKSKDAPLNFATQFQWTKLPLNLTRQSGMPLAEKEKLFAILPKQWSDVVAAPNGDLYFAYITEQLAGKTEAPELQDEVNRARRLLGYEAERVYLEALIPLLKEKKAISLDYLYSEGASLEEES